MGYGRLFRLVCVGGTFETIHAGHRRLLDEAFKSSDYILIGLTSDELALELGKPYKVSPYIEREERLRAYLDSRYKGRYSIVKLNDVYGVAIDVAELEAIFVTEETRVRAEEINRIRASRGLNPLEIVVVPFVLAEDGRPISSTRIKGGEIDSEGRLKPCR
ncbi:MAG: phosphopantetheine adenylyltransferase [Candidatus Bathyarchaeia archaeon]